MKKYLQDNRDQIFQNVQVSDVCRVFWQLMDAVRNAKDIDLYMEERPHQIRQEIYHMQDHEKDKFEVLKKAHNAKDHKAYVNGPDSEKAEDLVRSNCLSHMQRNIYLLHNRLTLEVMGEEMASFSL
jgi:hypothetical protein